MSLPNREWNERLNIVSPSVRHRSLLMAVRRSLLSINSLPHLVAQSWLDLCETLYRSGRLEAARVALRNAEICGLDREKALTQVSF